MSSIKQATLVTKSHGYQKCGNKQRMELNMRKACARESRLTFTVYLSFCGSVFCLSLLANAYHLRMQYMGKLVHVIATCTAIIRVITIAAEIISIVERGLEEQFGAEGH